MNDLKANRLQCGHRHQLSMKSDTWKAQQVIKATIRIVTRAAAASLCKNYAVRSRRNSTRPSLGNQSTRRASSSSSVGISRHNIRHNPSILIRVITLNTITYNRATIHLERRLQRSSPRGNRLPSDSNPPRIPSRTCSPRTQEEDPRRQHSRHFFESQRTR